MTIKKIGDFIIVKDVTSEPFLLATSYNSKLKTDKTLIEALKESNFKGRVFVDMLLKVGNGSQRFYSSFFNGKKFDMNNTHLIDKEDKVLNTLLKIERNVVCSNNLSLNNSVLTEYDKMEFTYSN